MRNRLAIISVAVLWLAVCVAPAVAQTPPEVDASKLFLFPGPRAIAPSGSRVTIDGSNIVVEPGSTAITTLGTITAGTWNGVVIGCAYGGTAQSSYAAGDLLYASAAPCTLAKLAIGTSGYWLRSTGTAPAWTAPAELSRVNDTNVTLALGGSPTTALLNAASMTLGWTGQLAPVRGGTGLDTSASSGVPSLNAGAWSINNVLTNTRVLFGGASNAISSDGDITFVTDTLTVTKAITPTSLTTPLVYAYGAPKSLTLGGTGIGCASGYATCEAPEFTHTGAGILQKLTTDAARRTRWYADTDGAHVQSYNGGGWAKLFLEGFTKARGGGFQVGAANIADPGLGNAAIDGYIGSADYVSQLTGWRVTEPGEADFRYLYTDELHAKAFIADLEQALAGGQLICKSVARVGAVFVMPSPTGINPTLIIKDFETAENMAVFESGDYIRFRTFSRGDTSTNPDSGTSLSITDAWGVVTGYTDLADGLQQWTFTRSAAPNAGAMATGGTIAIDALVIDYGTDGNGCHEVNAIDGLNALNSPYAQTFTWTGHPRSTTLRTRVGNLRGITGVANEFGAILGTYAATGGSFIRASNQALDIHGVTTKWFSGSTVVVTIVPNGTSPYFSIGNPAPSAYGANPGIFLGWNNSTSKAQFSAYADANNYVYYDGVRVQIKAANFTLDASGNITATSATLSGNITATTGNIGGFTVAATTLSATNLTLTAGAANTANIAVGTGANTAGMNSANAGTDIALWAGATHANRNSAPMRILANGDVLVTTLSTTGVVTVDGTGLRALNGSTTTPPYSFTNESGMGMLRRGAGLLAFVGGEIEFWASSTNQVGEIADGGLIVDSAARGTATRARKIMAGRNSSGSGAAGVLELIDKDGVSQWVWADNTGLLRIKETTAPVEDGGTTQDTGGTVVGSQSSTRASKTIFGDFTDYRAGLSEILQARLHNFQYTTCAFNCQQFVGVTTDDSPIFGLDLGRSLNVPTAFGMTFAAIKALHAEIDTLRSEVARLRQEKEK